MSSLGQPAVIIGGSIAWLITVRVLSNYFDHVAVLERHEVEDRPVIHRSVPQGNHLHGLLHGGQQVLSSLYPAFTEGATRVTVGRDIVWYLPDARRTTQLDR
jgi:hypothetical protein